MSTPQTKQRYRYAWKRDPWPGQAKRSLLHGLACWIVARGKMNSVLVEFDDGTREIISGNALRKEKP